MTVKELIIELLNLPMMATVELEVKTQKDYEYSCSTNIGTIWKSDRWVVIEGEEE